VVGIREVPQKWEPEDHPLGLEKGKPTICARSGEKRYVHQGARIWVQGVGLRVNRLLKL